MELERTLVLVKPDGVKRRLIGEVVTRFERVGLKVVGMKMIQADKELAMAHYTEDIAIRRGERVRQMVIDLLLSGPVVAVAIEGIGAVTAVRKLVGVTQPSEASPGTIRGDFAHISSEYANAQDRVTNNVVHASGNPEEAEAELKIWFKDGELVSYPAIGDEFLI